MTENRGPFGFPRLTDRGPFVKTISVPPIRQPSLEYYVELIDDKVIKTPKPGFEFKVEHDYGILRDLEDLSPLTVYDKEKNIIVQEAVRGRFATEDEMYIVRKMIKEKGYIPRGIIVSDVIVMGDVERGEFKVVDVGHFEKVRNDLQMAIKEATEEYTDIGMTLHDISNGHCYEWACSVKRDFPDAMLKDVDVWRYMGMSNIPYHVWIEYNNKAYDPESPNGVSDFRMLKYFKDHPNQEIISVLRSRIMPERKI